VRVEQREDPKIEQPTDAVIRLAATCVCGSDLWPYRGIEPVDGPAPMGHEYVGIVEETGRDVRTIEPGQFVIGSFFASDNTCEICRAGYQSSCLHREPMGALGTLWGSEIRFSVLVCVSALPAVRRAAPPGPSVGVGTPPGPHRRDRCVGNSSRRIACAIRRSPSPWTLAPRCATCRTMSATRDPRTTRRYDHSRDSLDRNAAYAVAAYPA
jgi:hypothetical protein